MKQLTSHLVKLASLADPLGWLNGATRGAVVLAFHRIGGESGYEIDLSVELLRSHLQLVGERFRFVTLAEVADTLRSGGRFERPVAAVTFDDAYADFAGAAVGELERAGAPATLFVPTGFIDREIASPVVSHGGSPPAWPPLSWDGLRELAAGGLVELAAHSHAHRDVTELSAAELREDTERCIDRLVAETGRRPRFYAYPRGRYSPEAESLLAGYFDAAVLACGGPVPAGCTPLRIPRAPVLASDGERWFARRISGRLRLDEAIRLRRSAGLRRAGLVRGIITLL